VDINNKLMIASLSLLFILSFWMVLDPFVFAQGEIEDEIEDLITENAGELVDRLTEDLNFDQGNFLNTNEEETQALKESGKDVFNNLIDLAFSTKGMAKAGIEFLSPFEMSAILVSVIALAITIFFVISMVKAVGKHIIIMVILGMIIVGIFVWFRINS